MTYFPTQFTKFLMEFTKVVQQVTFATNCNGLNSCLVLSKKLSTLDSSDNLVVILCEMYQILPKELVGAVLGLYSTK